MGLGISASACGQCHTCACVFMRIYMRIHMYVGIYIYAFFCSECYMHFAGVLGTSAWAVVYVTQVYFYTKEVIKATSINRTHLRTHSLQIVHICVYVYMCVCATYAYGCVCASMILLDTLRCCC